MLGLFRALTDRIKALFVTTVALDFEADLLIRDAERKAELLRLADRYEEEGMEAVAEPLRRQAEALSLERPLAGVLPGVEHLIGNGHTALLPGQPTNELPEELSLPRITARAKKKGR